MGERRVSNMYFSFSYDDREHIFQGLNDLTFKHLKLLEMCITVYSIYFICKICDFNFPSPPYT